MLCTELSSRLTGLVQSPPRCSPALILDAPICCPHSSQSNPIKPKLMSLVTALLRISPWSCISPGDTGALAWTPGPHLRSPGFPLPLSLPVRPAHTVPATLMLRLGPPFALAAASARILSPGLCPLTSSGRCSKSLSQRGLPWPSCVRFQLPPRPQMLFVVFCIGASSFCRTVLIYFCCLFAACPPIST